MPKEINPISSSEAIRAAQAEELASRQQQAQAAKQNLLAQKQPGLGQANEQQDSSRVSAAVTNNRAQPAPAVIVAPQPSTDYGSGQPTNQDHSPLNHFQEYGADSSRALPESYHMPVGVYIICGLALFDLTIYFFHFSKVFFHLSYLLNLHFLDALNLVINILGFIVIIGILRGSNLARAIYVFITCLAILFAVIGLFGKISIYHIAHSKAEQTKVLVNKKMQQPDLSQHDRQVLKNSLAKFNADEKKLVAVYTNPMTYLAGVFDVAFGMAVVIYLTRPKVKTYFS